MHVPQFGIKLAEELYEWYNTEYRVHVLHCDTSLMDFYKCLVSAALALTRGAEPFTLLELGDTQSLYLTCGIMFLAPVLQLAP